MADVLPPPLQASPRSLPKARQGPAWPGGQAPSPLSTALPRPFAKGCHSSRNIHLGLDTFSPVNQNGSFEFDRVLKCGTVQKRTRKTKVCHLTLSAWGNVNTANRSFLTTDMEAHLPRASTKSALHI